MNILGLKMPAGMFEDPTESTENQPNVVGMGLPSFLFHEPDNEVPDNEPTGARLSPSPAMHLCLASCALLLLFHGIGSRWLFLPCNGEGTLKAPTAVNCSAGLAAATVRPERVICAGAEGKEEEEEDSDKSGRGGCGGRDANRLIELMSWLPARSSRSSAGAGHREGQMMMIMMALFCLSKRTPLFTHSFLTHSSHSVTNQVLKHFDRLVGSAKPPPPVHHRHRRWLIA